MRFKDSSNKLPAIRESGNYDITFNDISQVYYDTESKLNDIKRRLINSKEVIELSKKIDVQNPNSILRFGYEPAEEISKFADKILHSIRANTIEGSSTMLKKLAAVMNKFDKDELKGKKQGAISRLFYDGKKNIERMLSKYKSLGSEINKIYKEINRYKVEIEKTNNLLEEMFVRNLKYYKELEKYILACNLVIKEIETEDIPYYMVKAQSGDSVDAVNYQTVNNTLELLKQRSYDLELAKMVAMQTAPQIRIIQKGNYKLIGKIQSAFIVTIPIFKNGLIQAVTLKRQKLAAETISALDRTTNELLLKNADNIKKQSIEIAKLSSSSVIKVETLERTWNTIVDGINETNKIIEENKKIREDGMKKINTMQIDYINKMEK